MIATFIGHRKIQNCERLTEQIKRTVLNLIDEKQVDTFLFGSRSAFDDLCMIDKADICIFYYNENYQPPLKLATKKRIFSFQPKSGTKIAYDYAVQKKKTIINLFK